MGIANLNSMLPLHYSTWLTFGCHRSVLAILSNVQLWAGLHLKLLPVHHCSAGNQTEEMLILQSFLNTILGSAFASMKTREFLDCTVVPILLQGLTKLAKERYVIAKGELEKCFQIMMCTDCDLDYISF